LQSKTLLTLLDFLSHILGWLWPSRFAPSALADEKLNQPGARKYPKEASANSFEQETNPYDVF
jgi:hypothetical protein